MTNWDKEHALSEELRQLKDEFEDLMDDLARINKDLDFNIWERKDLEYRKASYETDIESIRLRINQKQNEMMEIIKNDK
ncbi:MULTISPECIES: hypothetical protein [Ureaplasma]|nr:MULTISPECIES: hypothetical protein [Ureaplasma]ACA32908.1 conserved hypothetical protein [Ureaplasma parvum serovar 3 str. ATCC 27815]ACI60194.1 conserved hypothetical protein [Ureaplasma urealyticum serovar 10 str. ATCC 33699]EDU06225.1 conserved hypothetical protein [Ureaplasma urealyticum serovar 5 str. ATCC 27817]EDU56629.1 conserved hypothetical protein [Ureaplasma urealyticum serovar 7 str. ATCC 27819]EDU67346.1 conserved hypothetical protein [Ureaplasma urealyticum serovar 11 str. AT